ncbi:MAG: ParB/RepB/Spo0J family partition protein [Bryobacterales bacterium]|nr:ParB/RepB/Spo0J family partition protein [Bryobacterales bacterium]MBV9401850.1 ParB/RepB/Spo0J family partition protein [Bryobacterales bacterium]
MSNGADKSRKPLGRGLSALLPSRSVAVAVAPAAAAPSPATIPIDAIVPNPVQPRSVFESQKLEELAESIRANGIIQPLIVRRTGENYQIIAGERRWRAARIAGLTEVPIVVQDVADRQMLELALIENIQREDLNPIETAHAYDRLAKELGLSQEEIGRRTGKDRTSITNTLRLLRLPKEVQILVAEHRISMGHARAILGLASADAQIQLAEKAAAQGLSVRQVEKLVSEEGSAGDKSRSSASPVQDPNVRAAEEELQRTLGTRVRIVELSDQRGRVEVDYFSQAELDRLYQQIVGNR